MIRHAVHSDLSSIMQITNDASLRLKNANIPQWQSGYPNLLTFEKDIDLKQLYVVIDNLEVVAFASISLEEDPNYSDVVGGEWQVMHPSVVVHRLAVKNTMLNKGFAKQLYLYAEQIAKSKGRHSIKVDTHRLNLPMRNLLSSLSYREVGSIKLAHDALDPMRIAYEKMI